MDWKAKQFLKDAELLRASKRYESMVSRAYYAVFRRAQRWLEIRNIDPGKYGKRRNNDRLDYWNHTAICSAIKDKFGGNGKRMAGRIKNCRTARVQADYYPEPIIESEAIQVMKDAKFVLGRIRISEDE